MGAYNRTYSSAMPFIYPHVPMNECADNIAALMSSCYYYNMPMFEGANVWFVKHWLRRPFTGRNHFFEAKTTFPINLRHKMFKNTKNDKKYML